jgi:hypothetical protein
MILRASTHLAANAMFCSFVGSLETIKCRLLGDESPFKMIPHPSLSVASNSTLYITQRSEHSDKISLEATLPCECSHRVNSGRLLALLLTIGLDGFPHNTLEVLSDRHSSILLNAKHTAGYLLQWSTVNEQLPLLFRQLTWRCLAQCHANLGNHDRVVGGGLCLW